MRVASATERAPQRAPDRLGLGRARAMMIVGGAAIITGAIEADLAAAELKAANARVIVNVNYPTRSRALAPDAVVVLGEPRPRRHLQPSPRIDVLEGGDAHPRARSL